MSITCSYNVKSVTIADVQEFGKRARAGDVTPDDVRGMFASITASREALRGQLDRMTKAEIVKIAGRGYSDEKKMGLIRRALDRLAGVCALGRPVCYAMFSGSYEEALGELVAGTTADDIAKYAAENAKYAADIAAKMEAVRNPKTLKDFNLARQARRLTASELLEYDELKSAEIRDQKAPRVKSAPVDSSGVIETAHTKTGAPLFVVQLSARVERDEYTRLLASAKAFGGWYSSYSTGGAVPGFQFKTREDAAEFAGLISSGEPLAVLHGGEGLRELADKITADARGRLERDRLTNTAKRAREASYADDQARADIALAETMRRISAAHESGELRNLRGVKTRAACEMIARAVRRVHYLACLAQREKTGGRLEDIRESLELTPEMMIHAERFPAPVYLNTAKGWADELSDQRGSVRIGRKLAQVVAAASNEGRDVLNLTVAFMDEMAEHLRGAEGVRGDILADYRRWRSLGVSCNENYRAVLREFLGYMAPEPEADPVTKLERAIVGQVVGVDFFPTPCAVAAGMAARAGIVEGARVLEPSAGNGNLAEAARDLGASVECVELSSTLREILTARGFEVVADDFEQFDGAGYDAVIMNPPFSGGADIRHVRRAFGMLKHGGRLVAIVGAGAMFRGDRAAVEFRQWLDEIGATVEDLPDGTFADRTLLATTNARACLIVADNSEVNQ